MIEKEKLVNLVGASNVVADKAGLAKYSRDISFVNPVKPACLVKPRNAEEIKQLVKLANETLTPLVPVSSGGPHFRGDTIPGLGGAIIVDLSSLNKIVKVDRPRRVAMVEPGVTFGELIPAAAREGIRLNMPLLPRNTKSVVASMLEREPVLMPKYQWDISDPLACIEIIFGSGDEFRTGQAAGPGSVEEQWAVGGIQKAPYGPGIASLHRMVQGSQGTMGIVTWASLRCELLPALEEPFLVTSGSLSPLVDMAAWLIRLRMVNECFILNHAGLANIMAQKWPGDYQAVNNSLPQWILFYVIAGYEYYPEERVGSHIKNISEITQRLGVEAVKSVGGISANAVLKTIQQPSAEPYWKMRYKGAFQDIFFLTINDKLENQISVMNNLADKAGYPTSDLGVYIQPVVQGTGVHCEFSLFYDPLNKSDVNRIRELNSAAVKGLLSQGAFFSRPYGENPGLIINRDAASLNVVKKLKNMFDPNHIMNPGKLGF